MKLLLAIAQAAFTPNNNKEWIEIGFEGMAKTVSYLDEKRDLFSLYGATFLQMKEISSAKNKDMVQCIYILQVVQYCFKPITGRQRAYRCRKGTVTYLLMGFAQAATD